ncbi:salicylate carboxymethyltransferase-like [Papaver somniferum]|uniref:salicylate carboxymethyltransferase-like n=1 Tax=Papaver somniferum TaxID=3469 RepID=UPI000E6FFEEC|nr:salicylate carboxymethyltransferase-like [Papaver somniferum]
MDVNQQFHMNGGNGETSYSSNSTLQRKGVEITKPIIEETIIEIINTMYLASPAPNLSKSISIADMDCSSGPNALLVVSYVMNTVFKTLVRDLGGVSRASTHPEILVFLNDLAGNDFNSTFKSLQGFYDELKKTYNRLGGHEGDQRQQPCFVAGIPGSFYARLFPADSLHFVHSSYSLHWLSQVPQGIEKINKGNVYMVESSPPSVVEAYLNQFEREFELFLKCRSEEVVKGGRMVLTTSGRANDVGPCRLVAKNIVSSGNSWQTFSLTCYHSNHGLMQRKIEAEKLESFHVPLYIPSSSEVKSIILREGSFIINRLETFEVTLDGVGDDAKLDGRSNADVMVNSLRAISEPLLASRFGVEIIEELFCRLGIVV